VKERISPGYELAAAWRAGMAVAGTGSPIACDQMYD